MWAAEAPSSTAKQPVLYVALFNNGLRKQPVGVTLQELGLDPKWTSCDHVLDVWSGSASSISITGGHVSAVLVGSTGAELLQISHCA